MEKLILASASPQRKTLLEGLGIPFEVVPSMFNERTHPDMKDPVLRAQALAREKAQEVASRMKGKWVLGCDTLVVADGQILEKPVDATDAERMLRLQSGKVSVVHSGLTLVDSRGTLFEGVSSSRVRFKQLSDEDIAWWIETGQWEDRSGSFQIDGLGQCMIEHLEGDWTGVVGLPVFLLGQLFQKAGMII
ncbi:septum formation protein Maf [Candidatus Peregrinibacteria bacterium]|nr:septum formation protein Maf [Candidatus Peregrinibacteria bacterium]